MLRRNLRLTSTLSVVIGVAMATGLAGGRVVAQEDPDAGPPCAFKTELIDGRALPLKDAAMIVRTKCGYRYRAGQQDSHLVIRQVKSGLRFADTRTERFTNLPRSCRKIKGVTGVAAVCEVPSTASTRRPLLIEVWPRLGDDYTDGSSLSARFAMAVLGDAGNDVALLGAGPDFFNGAFDRDRVRGGAGDDWIRSGTGHDRVWGGTGNEHIVGGDGSDLIYGGGGADRLYCGVGNDKAVRDKADIIVWQCERVGR